MNVATKVSLFAAALLVAFGAAAALGSVVNPIGDKTPTAHHKSDSPMTSMPGMSPGPTVDSGKQVPGGLQISENGYRLEFDSARQEPNPAATVSFTVVRPDGKPLTNYTAVHDKKLHFIAVKRDLSGFQHVHPALDKNGTWATTLSLTSGQWRVFADFDPAGKTQQMTLGADLAVAGMLAPQPLPASSRTATVDGYTVTLDGNLTAGTQSKLTLSVAKDGTPVTDLQPYLAAYGHLVALREGDLAYLHVHPDGAPGDGKTEPGPDVTFYAEAPSAGNYRLYLDFKHHGAVHTAEFTVAATAQAHGTDAQSHGSAAPADEPSHDGH